jgi:soluble lytic murein transglycosylase-like protein
VSGFASTVANCWLAAATAFEPNVPPALLYAIAKVETAFDPRAIEFPRNGTRSVGVMQINSIWFDELAAAGISEKELYDPCVNIHAGAWILSQEVKRYGYTWEAIGAYNAGPYDAKSRPWKLKHYRAYATKVLRAWRALIEASESSSTLAAR